VRTVFIYNLPFKAEEHDVFEFFSAAGEINDIRLITDRHTKRSRGLCYIEYSKQVGAHHHHHHRITALPKSP
jgi:RNA-binding protein 39